MKALRGRGMRFSEVLRGSLDDDDLISSGRRGETSGDWKEMSPSNTIASLVFGSDTCDNFQRPVSENDPPRSLGEPISRTVERE